MRSPLTEKKQAAGFGVKTSHSDKKNEMDFDSTHFLQYLRFFLKNCNFVKMHFYQNFEILNFFLGLIISFWALVCKLGSKNVFLSLCHFWWFFLDFPIFCIYRKWEFPVTVFLKSFPQIVLVLSHTLSNSFRLCKFKKVG